MKLNRKKQWNFFQQNQNLMIWAKELILPKPCFNLHQLFVTQDMVYILTSETVGINKSPKQQLLETRIKSSYELTRCTITRKYFGSWKKWQSWSLELTNCQFLQRCQHITSRTFEFQKDNIVRDLSEHLWN